MLCFMCAHFYIAHKKHSLLAFFEKKKKREKIKKAAMHYLKFRILSYPKIYIKIIANLSLQL